MKLKDVITYYRLNLPHIQPVGATFFVTFRLEGSVPKRKLFRLKKEYEAQLHLLKRASPKYLNKAIYELRRDFFLKYDDLLDQISDGPHFLKLPEVAALIEKELHQFDSELYDLIAFCIMSNHVHILIDTSLQIPEDVDDINTFENLEITSLKGIMKRIKGPTAIYANRLLGRNGKFWQRESYDHYIRNEKDLEFTITYILENPVKAGIVEKWEDYPYSYFKYL